MAYTSALYSAIEIDITANDLTQKGVDSAVGNLKKIDDQSILTTANLAKITAAFGAITAVGLTFASAADRVEELQISGAAAAVTANMTSDAFYEMADSMDEVSDPIEDVIASQNYLTHNGIILEAEIKSLALSFDDLADGVGQSASQTERELIPMMRALGIPLQDVTKYTSALTIAVQTTNLTLGDLANYSKRYGEQFSEMGAGLPEIIALFETLSQLGIDDRQMRSKLNEMFNAQGENTKIAADGMKDLVKIQKELNEAQVAGSKTTRDYLEDMQAAGGDVGKMRQIAMAYQRKQREDQEKITEKRNEAAAIQATINTAKSAPKFSFDDAIAKLHEIDPRITKENVSANYTAQSSPENQEKVAEWKKANEMTTGGQQAAFFTDEKMRQLGAHINPAQSKMITLVADVAGIATTALGILTILKAAGGIGGGGDLFTTAAGVGTIGAGSTATETTIATIAAMGGVALFTSVLAGLGIGLTVVGILEQMGLLGLPKELGGTGKGWVQEQGAKFSGATAREDEAQYIQKYTIKGELPPGYERQTGTGNIVKKSTEPYAGSEPVLAEGGVVPGPIGAPVRAIVHGGETVTPVGGNAGGLSISIGNVNLSKDYPFDQMMKDIEMYQKTKRQQRGVRTGA